MKHAIMVMGFGNDSSILQQTINILDDSDIDFFIHWDRKYNKPLLYSNYSKIIFVPRIKVNWATDKQIIVEKLLMQNVKNNSKSYDYVHLISSSDMPLMTSNYFKGYFKEGTSYIGFVDYLELHKFNRLNHYFPIRHFNIKSKFIGEFIIKLCNLFNNFFQINRIKHTNIEHGCNWFSMDARFVNYVLDFSNFNMFKNTLSGDEFYVQTILQNLKPKNINNSYNYYSDNYRMTESSKMALRYIDWYRGSPYIFNNNNIIELKKRKNTNYAFARKISNDYIVKKVFNLY